MTSNIKHAREAITPALAGKVMERFDIMLSQMSFILEMKMEGKKETSRTVEKNKKL